jgi:hypothetical protein
MGPLRSRELYLWFIFFQSLSKFYKENRSVAPTGDYINILKKRITLKKENYKRGRDSSKRSMLFAPKFEWHYAKDARVAAFVENIICLSSSATSLILQRSKQKERGQEYIGASSMHHIRSVSQSWRAFPIQCGAFCWIACTTSSKCVMLIATCPWRYWRCPLKAGSRSLDEAEAEESQQLGRARLDWGCAPLMVWPAAALDEQA